MSLISTFLFHFPYFRNHELMTQFYLIYISTVYVKAVYAEVLLYCLGHHWYSILCQTLPSISGSLVICDVIWPCKLNAGKKRGNYFSQCLPNLTAPLGARQPYCTRWNPRFWLFLVKASRLLQKRSPRWFLALWTPQGYPQGVCLEIQII